MGSGVGITITTVLLIVLVFFVSLLAEVSEFVGSFGLWQSQERLAIDKATTKSMLLIVFPCSRYVLHCILIPVAAVVRK